MSYSFLSRRRFLQATVAGATALTLPVWARSQPGETEASESPVDLAEAIDGVLWNQIVPAWYPRSVDESGGFHERFDRQWNREPAATKCIVYQARMTWTPAFLATRYPARRESMLLHARHGVGFLRDTMWDSRYGGFHERVLTSGRPDPAAPWKNLYGEAFGLFAASTVYEATGDAAALALAQDAFDWIERHMRDPRDGGYFEHTSADGQVQMVLPPGLQAAVVGRVGCKSMNAHIHILEALAALYRVWKTERVRERLMETFHIVRDKIVAPDGYLVMFADPKFQPIEAYSSFGHQLETAYLLDEAMELLELHEDHAELERTHGVIRSLVDHSMRYGRDHQHGSFYNEGPAMETPEHRTKIWWVVAESFNGLLTAHRLFGSVERDYFRAFEESWRFFDRHMIDRSFGGCYSEVEEDGTRIPGRDYKANPWKTAYHVVRAVANSAGWLRALPVG